MAKKLLALFVFVILAGVALLWYLGGEKIASKASLASEASNASNLSIHDKTTLALVGQELENPNTPEPPLQPLKTYKPTDLKLAKQDDRESITIYAARVKEIMAIYESAGIGNEIGLVLAVVERGDQAAVTQLGHVTRLYQTSISELLALEVPKSAAGLHLNLINNLSRLGEGALAMSKINSEPAAALAAAQMQTSRIKPALAAVGNLNLFFAGHGITS